MKKSYNKDALRGSADMTDDMWAEQVAEATGINIPKNLLYTPDGPVYLMKKIRDMNMAQMGEDNIPTKAAMQAAENQYKAARESYDGLLKFNQKNDTEE